MPLFKNLVVVVKTRIISSIHMQNRGSKATATHLDLALTQGLSAFSSVDTDQTGVAARQRALSGTNGSPRVLQPPNAPTQMSPRVATPVHSDSVSFFLRCKTEVQSGNSSIFWYLLIQVFMPERGKKKNQTLKTGSVFYTRRDPVQTSPKKRGTFFSFLSAESFFDFFFRLATWKIINLPIIRTRLFSYFFVCFFFFWPFFGWLESWWWLAGWLVGGLKKRRMEGTKKKKGKEKYFFICAADEWRSIFGIGKRERRKS